MAFNGDNLARLMEREDELFCDISLYKNQIFQLQLDFQSRKIDIDEYTNSYDLISAKISLLTDELSSVSSSINNIIRDFNNGEVGNYEEYNDGYYNSGMYY